MMVMIANLHRFPVLSLSVLLSLKVSLQGYNDGSELSENTDMRSRAACETTALASYSPLYSFLKPR